MKLISIETVNFKRLRHFKAEFTDGLNVIVGDNAKGKSTLLQAIEAALYGSTVVPGKKDAIPTWGQTTWKIVLRFSFDEQVYELTRSKSTAKLVRTVEGEEELVANGSTSVTQYIAELLDLDAKDYNLFMQSKQGETSGVMTFGAAALNRKVESFAGIDVIDRVQSLAQQSFRDHKAAAEASQVEPSDLEGAEADAEHTLKEANEAAQEVSKAEANLRSFENSEPPEKPTADASAMRQQRERHHNQVRAKERAEGQVEMAEAELATVTQQFNEAEEPGDADALEKQISRAKSHAAENKKNIRESNELLSGVKSQMAELEKLGDVGEPEDVEAIKASVEFQSTDVDNLVNIMATRKAEHASAKKMLANAICPTCEQSIGDHDPEVQARRVKDLLESFNVAVEQKKVAEALLNQTKSLLDHAEKKNADIEKAEELRVSLESLDSVETIETKLEFFEDFYSRDEGERRALESELEALEACEARYRRLRRAVKAATSAYEEAKDSVPEATETLVSLEDIAAAEKAREEYDALVQERKETLMFLNYGLEIASKMSDSAQREYERAAAYLKELKDRQERSSAAEKSQDKAGRLAKFLRSRRADYLKEVWDAVLAAASKQVNNASRGSITRLAYDEGEFFFEEESIMAPVTSASGAQKAHIGVALRVGLSRALYGSDALLIFDEPTEAMSEDNAASLTASLAGAATQCLVITHREQDQDLASGVIELV